MIPAPEGAAETPYDQNIRADLPSPFPGLSARGFLAPRVPLHFTLGYDFVALPGLKAALCGSSRVSRQKLARERLAGLQRREATTLKKLSNGHAGQNR